MTCSQLGNKECQELLSQLKASQGKPNPFFRSNYGGSNDPSLDIPHPKLRQIAKEFVKKHPDFSLPKLLGVLSFLNQGRFGTEKTLGGMLLQFFPKLRAQVQPAQVDAWLDNLRGWSQVDSLCQSVFTAEDLISNWERWREAIVKLSKDENINKRRASLVLLTAPVRQSSDKRFSCLAFSIINRLARERGVLVTKAVSWLLRDLIRYHRAEVIAYLEDKKSLLPKIAVRETRRKLATGRK